MDAAEGVGEAEMTTPPTNINILVVDDDPTTLNIVSAMLKTWSYQVVAVRNPIDALATLRKGKCSFDLVVTDLHMPQMNGLELQKRVHEEFELPVIMMSADDKESVILKSLEGGVVYYIVKPVSREDIQNVWQYVSQSKKSKYSNVVIEDMMESTPGEFEPAGNNLQLHQGPGEVSIYDKDGVTFFEDEHSNEGNSKEGGRRESSKRKTRKRDRGDLEDEEDDDGEHNRRMGNTKKHKVVWSNSLHNQFLMAIRHIGLDKAVPKRILEYMNVPTLTRENVASHLQKYRMFLKKVAEKARLSKCLSDRVFRSNFAYGNHPSMASFNSTQREQYAEYLKQQLQMNNLGIPTPLSVGNNHNGQLPCRLNTASNLGSFRFPVNYNQQPAALNQFAGSGQSRLLMDKTSQQQQQQTRAMQLGNGMNLYNSQANCSRLGMQMMMNNNNNVGNVGAGYGGLMNNNGGNGNGILNNGANNWMQMYSQQSRANLGSRRVNFGVTPGISTPSIENMMTVDNNVNLTGTNFGAGGVTRSAPGFNNFMNGGYSNAMPTNSQETVNGPSMHGVRSVNLTGGTPFNAPTILGNARINSNVSSSRFGGGANQFAPAIPRNHQQQQCFGASNNSVSFDDLMSNASNIFNTISLDGDEDDIMVVNNLVMEQLDNYQPPDQQQGGYEIPVDLNNILHQDEVTSHANQVDPNPISTPVPDSRFQANTNRATSNGQAPQLSTNPDANGQFQLNPTPATPIINSHIQPSFDSAVNDHVHLNHTSAANEYPLDQLDPTANMVENLADLSGPGDMYHVENVVPTDEHSWIQEEQGGDQQMLNSEFDSNMFQSEDYSSLFDQQFVTQDGDDDFFQAMMAFDNY